MWKEARLQTREEHKKEFSSYGGCNEFHRGKEAIRDQIKNLSQAQELKKGQENIYIYIYIIK